MQLKALLVDDEFHARENLRMLLNEHCPEIQVAGDASGVKDALSKVTELTPDVVFLDIRMPSGAEGFEFLKSIPEPDFQVVFVTAFKDYAVQAFHANAIHYLLKPVDIDDLRAAVDRLLLYQRTFADHSESRSQYVESLRSVSDHVAARKPAERITLHHSRGFRIVRVDDIVRLESDGSCTRLFFNSGESYLDTRHLKVYEDMLPTDRFFRCHRSHLIRLDAVREYLHHEGSTAILSDGADVPIARARLSEFLTRIRQV